MPFVKMSTHVHKQVSVVWGGGGGSTDVCVCVSCVCHEYAWLHACAWSGGREDEGLCAHLCFCICVHMCATQVHMVICVCVCVCLCVCA
jgi:hypothetical protein